MPVCSFTKIGANSAHLLWRIHESEATLLKYSALTTLAQKEYQKITHPCKRKEWLATRLALSKLLIKLGHTHTELRKDAWGKPYLVGSNLHISIAHCASFAFAAVASSPIGIDIQLPCKQLQRVKRKFLDDIAIEDSGSDLEKLCVYWCAKEAIYKAYGGRGLSLKQGISISTFKKMDRGIVWGKVGTKLFAVHYDVYDSYVLAWSRKV